MTFERLYRASLYVMLLLASLLLSVDASNENRYLILYPVAVGALSLLAFLTVDRDPRRGLPRDVANFLAAIAAAFGFLEWYNDPNTILQAIGHTLIYLQILKTFLPKTVEDDWFLFLIGVVESVIGVHTPQSDFIGVLLIAWAVISLWTFGLFFLRRESLRAGPGADVLIRPMPDPANPYPGLINFGFVLSALRIAATTLALGGAIFVLMPRWPVQGVNRFGQTPAAKHLTGFSTEVKLGQMGEILENDSIVLSVEFSNETGEVITPEPDVLLRGVTLVDYKDGGWQRAEVTYRPAERLGPPIPERAPILRQRIIMEATDSDTLFAVRPILRVRTGNRGETLFNTIDGALARRDLREDFGDTPAGRPGRFIYTVISRPGNASVQPGEVFPFAGAGENLTALSPDLRESLREFARPVLDALRPEARASRLAVAEALERHLRDGPFTYSLRMRRTDQSLDPVLDFLRNQKEGHCEYFASALTLLCRAHDIPARMVNGFKGGDWNELGQVLHVRGKHAHSWVEVLVNQATPPEWVTLDPTPSRQRNEVVAQVGGNGNVRYFSDYLRKLWMYRVVGYDAERQEREVYGPLRQLGAEANRGFHLVGQMLRNAMKWLYFEDVGQFFSVRGFFVSFFGMLMLVSAYRTFAWVFGRLLGRFSDGSRKGAAEDPGVAFYYRLVRALRALDLARGESETPREFARRASVALESRAEMQPFGDLPAGVVELFYAKKFGQRDLAPEALHRLDERIGALEGALAGAR